MRCAHVETLEDLDDCHSAIWVLDGARTAEGRVLAIEMKAPGKKDIA